MSKHQRITDRVKVYEGDLVAAEREYAHVLITLEATPQDKQLLEQRDRLEREITDTKLKIARERVKLEHAAAQDTTAARAAEIDQSERDAAHVEKNLQRIAELDESLADQLQALRPLLAEREQLAADNASLVWGILVRCYGAKGAERRESLRELARGISARGSIVDALFASGLGRLGLELGDFVSIAPARVQRTLSESAVTARDKVSKALRAAIEHRKNPAESEQEVPTQRDRFIKGGRHLERKDDFVSLRDRGFTS